MNCRILLAALLFSLQMNVKAQCFSDYVFPSEGEKYKVLENTEYRNIVGGTVINVKYKGGNFNAQKRGAFEYACKIWEEKIPTTLPIKIAVQFDNIKNPRFLAKVDISYDEDGSQEKIFTKRESISYETYYPLYSLEFIRDTPDVTITFASPALFDYSLDADDINPEKYDFVTVALQAIGKALGFCLNAIVDGTSMVKSSKSNQFTKRILSENGASNYVMATSGNAKIKAHDIDGYYIYSPEIYDPKHSLNYFAINRNDRETLLMQPGVLSKGSVIRYLGDEPWAEFFSFCGWDRAIATGTSNAETIVEAASTGDVIPYNSNSVESSAAYCVSETDDHNKKTVESYLNNLREFYEVGTFVLLNDGTWEKCNDKLSDLKEDGDYARTIDGYLRIKQCKTKYRGQGWRNFNYAIYRLADYIPQKPISSVIGYHKAAENAIPAHRTPAMNNPTYYDVVIGFKNTEGCEEIEVEQIDDDYPIPYYYYVDPKDGKFTATISKDVKSTFKLSYINKNGKVSGKPFSYSIPTSPLVNGEGPDMSGVIIEKDKIKFDFSGNTDKQYDAYNIISLCNGNIVDKGNIDEPKGEISTINLPKGNYSLSITGTKGEACSVKWTK